MPAFFLFIRVQKKRLLSGAGAFCTEESFARQQVEISHYVFAFFWTDTKTEELMNTERERLRADTAEAEIRRLKKQLEALKNSSSRSYNSFDFSAFW